MYYITVKQHRKAKQLTWEDVIADNVVLNDFTLDASNATATVTRKFETINQEVLDKVDVDGIIDWLKMFNEHNKKLFEAERRSLYHSFKIPKSTGGFRQIDAPCDELKTEMSRLVNFIKNDCGVLYHTSAFAYVEGRSIVDNNRKHQKNESNWYLKTDFSGFFPSTTVEFAMKMLSMVFPLSEVCKRPDGYDALSKAISLSFIDDSLVQGSPLSPFLTNWLMIPIDHAIFNELAHRNIVYTRYADDMHISAKDKFPWQEVVEIIRKTLKEFGAPYEIKKEKTHFGSRKGKNWCLGLMINAENNITVGYKKKQWFKAALSSFILDTKNGKPWDIGDVQHLRGQLSYYMMVEPEYFKEIVNRQNSKWNVNVKEMFKKYLNGSL